MPRPSAPFALLLASFLALAQPVAPSRLFPLEPYQALAAPWLAASSEQPLFAAGFQAPRRPNSATTTWAPGSRAMSPRA